MDQVKIAIFDYKVQPSNPAGGCHWRLLRGLSTEHEFTVFSVDLDNPDPERIKWVRIPAPRRPLALLYVVYHLLAPIYFRRYLRKSGARFDLVQSIESNLAFGDISYAHFCHRHYLRCFWPLSRQRGLRPLLRWLDHWLHAYGERLLYRRVRRLVVPSVGLLGEIEAEYPETQGRVEVVSNPVELARFESPVGFDRASFRDKLGIRPEDSVAIFAGLGHFERKGLPALIEAMSLLDEPRLKLLVVGGESDALSAYRSLAKRLSVQDRVIFVGAQRDVRPYFWSGDVFTLPSCYETFSLVTYEAAAAGLPLIVAVTNGIEDILRDGDNGIRIGTEPSAVLQGLRRFIKLSDRERRDMGVRAKVSVQKYSTAAFINAWRTLYSKQAGMIPQGSAE